MTGTGARFCVIVLKCEDLDLGFEERRARFEEKTQDFTPKRSGNGPLRGIREFLFFKYTIQIYSTSAQNRF
jgi:hypothetical protein